MRKASSAVTVTRLIEMWSNFGPPRIVVSDNARCFTSHQFSGMCLRWGIRHITTTPYHPSGNMVERPNRDIKAAVTIMLKQYEASHKDWDKYVSYIKLSHNAGYHETTRTSPASVFLGRELPVPLDRHWGIDLALDDEDKPSTATIQQAIRRSHAKYARYYNASRPPEHHFIIDQLVLPRLHDVAGANEDQKFIPRWSTPRRITRFTTPVSCELEDPETGQTYRAHIDQLKAYIS